MSQSLRTSHASLPATGTRSKSGFGTYKRCGKADRPGVCWWVVFLESATAVGHSGAPVYVPTPAGTPCGLRLVGLRQHLHVTYTTLTAPTCNRAGEGGKRSGPPTEHHTLGPNCYTRLRRKTKPGPASPSPARAPKPIPSSAAKAGRASANSAKAKERVWLCRRSRQKGCTSTRFSACDVVRGTRYLGSHYVTGDFRFGLGLGVACMYWGEQAGKDCDGVPASVVDGGEQALSSSLSYHLGGRSSSAPHLASVPVRPSGSSRQSTHSAKPRNQLTANQPPPPSTPIKPSSSQALRGNSLLSLLLAAIPYHASHPLPSPIHLCSDTCRSRHPPHSHTKLQAPRSQQRSAGPLIISSAEYRQGRSLPCLDAIVHVQHVG
ncbi:hypothetical protein L1887_54430 [Cichorium endivia]|nr:hypothetical protein L1887_54430 [Cichorium endivia]